MASFLLRRLAGVSTKASTIVPAWSSTTTAPSWAFNKTLRYLHGSPVRNNDDHGGPEHNVVELSAEKLDAKAVSFYAEHPRSHYALKLDNIEFYVGEHFVSGEPHPHCRVKNTEQSGLLNVTPFAKSLFSWFGEKGNLGKSSKFAKSFDGIISDPMEAAQEINLFPDTLDGSGGRGNQALVDYIDWMDALRTKYVDHLTDEIESYPILVKKLGFLIGRNDRDTLREMVSQLTNSPIRCQKDEFGFPKPETSFLPYKQALYFRGDKARATKSRIRCEMDAEMIKENQIRRHIPLYDRFGTEVPLEKASISPGDVISVETNITCQLFDVGGSVGAGLRRNIRSVVYLRSEQNGDGSGTSAESPFKDFSF